MSDKPDEPAPQAEDTPPIPPAETSEIPAPDPAPAEPAGPPVDTPPPSPEVITTEVPPDLPPAEPAAPPPPEPVPEPAPAPPKEPDIPPKSEELPKSEPPPPHTPAPAPGGIPPAVLALTDAELKAAAALFAQRHQRENSRKGVEVRQARMKENLDIVLAQVRRHGTVQIPRLTQDLDMSPGLVSNYLLMLLKQGKVKATGHGAGRRYSA